MSKKLIYTGLAALLFGIAGNAQVNQRNGEEDTLKTRIVTVFDYKPTISDAKKLAESPSVIDTTLPKATVNYAFDSRQLATTYKPDTIQPATMKGEPLDPLYRSHVRLGAGNGINYLGDLYMNTARSRDGALGLDLHTYGSQGVLKDLPPAAFNRMNGSVYGKRFFKKHELTGRVGYDRERLQYYGYDDTNPYYFGITDDDLFRQVYQEIFANVGLKSFYTDSNKLNHTVDVHYDRFMDRDVANSEHNVVLNATVSRFFKQHHGRLELLADMNAVDYVMPFNYTPIGTIAEKNTNTIVGLKPVMTSQAKKWRLELGLNIQAEISSAGTTPRLYPFVYAKYNLVKEIIIPYGGYTGGLQRNNLNKLTETNPFLWTNLTVLQNTNEAYNVFLGIKGAISGRITFNLQGSNYAQRNAPLFVNYDASEFNPGLSRFGENYFTVVYDSLETLEARGELTYRVDEKLQLIGSGVYRAYETTVEFEAWQRPAVEITVAGFYQLKDKIIVKGQVHFLGPQWSKSYDPASEKYFGFDGQRVYGNQLKSIIDANLGVEYRYTERLSAFLNINNLLSQRYQRWNQYPTQRFNILGGITYSFWKE